MNSKAIVPPEFCVAPWKMLHLSPQGDVYSCYESSVSLGNIHDQPLGEIWRGAALRNLRGQMLSGESVSACHKCHVKGKAILGKSLRTVVNEELCSPGTDLEVFRAKELEPDFSPSIMDLAFSNSCNLKCRMCSSVYSKLWIEDEIALTGKSIAGAKQLSNETIEAQIIPLVSPNLKTVILSGGEPFSSPGTAYFLERLVELGRTEVQLTLNTNGMVVPDRFLEILKNFQSVWIRVSLDDSHGRFEYLRKGAEWAKVAPHMAKIRAWLPKVRLDCYTTVNIFNVFTYPDFVRTLIGEGLFSPEAINFHYLVEPAYLSVQILPDSLKSLAKERYFELITGYLLREFDEIQVRRLTLQIKMLLNYMSMADGSSQIPRFREVTMKIDQIRGESFAQHFPELKGFG